MELKSLSREQAVANAINSLGVGDIRDLEAREVIAEALRCSAGFKAPCVRRELVDHVQSLFGILSENQVNYRELIESTLDDLEAVGDIAELVDMERSSENRHYWSIFLVSPSFVRGAGGKVLVIGVAPEGSPFLPETLRSRMERVGAARFIRALPDENLSRVIAGAGVPEADIHIWAKTPRATTARRFVDEMNRKLESAAPAGAITGLQFLDSAKPPNYYKGRWVNELTSAGNYIARRPQRFGADLWCYVHINGGVLRQFVDLQGQSTEERGCDVAWRLQLAMDALAGKPQQFQFHKDEAGSYWLDINSPVPFWAERRWNIFGERGKRAGALCSWKFETSQINDERTFATAMLWMKERS